MVLGNEKISIEEISNENKELVMKVISEQGGILDRELLNCG